VDLTLQGRYILSRPKHTDFKKVKEVLQAAYPEFKLAEPQSRPDKTAYDVSKVSTIVNSLS